MQWSEPRRTNFKVKHNVEQIEECYTWFNKNSYQLANTQYVTVKIKREVNAKLRTTTER